MVSVVEHEDEHDSLEGKRHPAYGSLIWHVVGVGFRRYSGFYVAALLVAVFGLIEPSLLFQISTLSNLAASGAITATIALGLIFPLAANEFDLSIGYTVGAAGMVSAWLVAVWHMGVVLSVALALLASVGFGLLNGLLVTVVGISSFIATLGSGSILYAFILALSHDEDIVGLPLSFGSIGGAVLSGIPIEVIYVAVVGVIAWYFLEHTPFGRRLYAIGGGREAARLAGVRPRRLIIASFVVSAAVAGFAGVVVTAQVNSASPDVGPSYLLAVFAAAFLGATQIKPGRVNAVGTLVGVYVISLGVMGLELGGAQSWVQSLFDGAVLLVAVGLSLPRAKVRGSGSAGRMGRLLSRLGGAQESSQSGP